LLKIRGGGKMEQKWGVQFARTGLVKVVTLLGNYNLYEFAL
jgi:hypothetical protein